MERVKGTIYTNVSDDWQRGLCPIARCIKAEKHDLAVVLEVEEMIVIGGEQKHQSIKTDGKKAFNIVEQETVKELGYIENGTGKHQSNVVYSDDGISPTITTINGGGSQQIKILSENISCKLDKMPDGHLDSLDNAKLCDVDTPTASTVTARYHKGIGAHKDNMVMVKQATKKGYAECELGGVADLSYPTSETRRGRVENKGQICPTLTASENGICRIETRYRIRKLTPLECWRLMGFSDNDFNKASEVNSNTQLYKQAGNSIVKQVLMAIMSQLNIKGVTPWNELSVEEKSI